MREPSYRNSSFNAYFLNFIFKSYFTLSFHNTHSSLTHRLTPYPWAQAACESVQAGCCVSGCRGAEQGVAPSCTPCPSSLCWGSSPSPAAGCWGRQGTSPSLWGTRLSGGSRATTADLTALPWGGGGHLVPPSKSWLCLPQQLHVQGLGGEQSEGQRP